MPKSSKKLWCLNYDVLISDAQNSKKLWCLNYDLLISDAQKFQELWFINFRCPKVLKSCGVWIMMY